MARKVHHKHSSIKDLKVRQFKKGNYGNPIKKGTIQNGGSLTLDSTTGSYFLEFQIKGNEYCTVDFAKTYGVEKFTRKKHDEHPQIDRLLFKVENLAGPYGKSPKPEDDNVEVKDPDSEPIDR